LPLKSKFKKHPLFRKGALYLSVKRPNYGLVLVAAGFVVEFEVVVLPFVVVVVVVVVVLVFVLVAAGAGVGVAGLFTLVVLAGLLVALLVLPASPQAIPKALRAKTDESAITFFITNSSLLSSSKNKSNLFLPFTRANTGCPKLKDFWKQTPL
jgi:hypothetical protein